MNSNINAILTELKAYCYNYIQLHYHAANDFIKGARITKNALYIYGHNVYAPILSDTYTIYIIIPWYDAKDYEYINTLLEHFVKNCRTLKEAN